MDIPKSRYEELESILPEDLVPIATEFLDGIDEVARGIAQIHEHPTQRQEVLDGLCTDEDVYISLRFPYSQEEYIKLFFVEQSTWNRLLNCPDARYKGNSKIEPYDLEVLNDEQLKALFDALIDKLKELRELSDLASYKQCLLFILQRVSTDFTWRANSDSNFVDEIRGEYGEIVEKLDLE